MPKHRFSAEESWEIIKAGVKALYGDQYENCRVNETNDHTIQLDITPKVWNQKSLTFVELAPPVEALPVNKARKLTEMLDEVKVRAQEVEKNGA